MTYMNLAYWHLFTILPAFMLGTYLLFFRKGTPLHKCLGRLYMLLMLATAIISLLMPAQIGFQLLHHFGPLHLLSVLAIYSVISAFTAIKQGNLRKHKISMLSLYCSGILLAGIFTLLPGRLLHSWIFGV